MHGAGDSSPILCALRRRKDADARGFLQAHIPTDGWSAIADGTEKNNNREINTYGLWFCRDEYRNRIHPRFGNKGMGGKGQHTLRWWPVAELCSLRDRYRWEWKLFKVGFYGLIAAQVPGWVPKRNLICNKLKLLKAMHPTGKQEVNRNAPPLLNWILLEWACPQLYGMETKLVESIQIIINCIATAIRWILRGI